MNTINRNTNSEAVAIDESIAMQEALVLPHEGDSISLKAPRAILQSALTALSAGWIPQVVTRFDNCFKFNDYALTLEFTQKTRLTEFLEKSRELFPDSALEVMSVMESGDYAVAEWKLTATQTVPFFGNTSYRLPISIRGATVIRVEDGRIVEWSDYYDQSSSRRMSLAAHFIERVEY
jgi:ketosteroid isomerase-like protein